MLREKVLTQESEEDWRDEFDLYINDYNDPFFINIIHIGALAIKASENNIEAILEEREKQKKKWSEEHDDQHFDEEWLDLIDKYVNDIDRSFNENMIIVGALALAAAESILRKKGKDE